MTDLSALSVSLATLLIATSGIAVILQQHALAWRLFVAGCITAIAAPLIAAHCGPGFFGSIATLAGWVAVAALCLAILGVRRWPFYLFVLTGAVFLTLPVLEPIMRRLLSYWWAVPIVLLVPVLAALLALGTLARLRGQIYRWNPRSTTARTLARLLNGSSARRHQRYRRQRHTPEFGPRGRNGRGPI